MPELRCINPGVDKALCRVAGAAARDEEYFEGELQRMALSDPVVLVDGAALPMDSLRGSHPAVSGRAVAKLIAAAGFTVNSELLGRVQALLNTGKKSKLNLPGGGLLFLGQHWLCAVSPTNSVLESTTLEVGRNSTTFGRFDLREAAPGERGDGMLCQAFPKRLCNRLRVTAHIPGETMTPFGCTGPVRISTLLSNTHLEQALRRSVPVVRASCGIVWLAGIRPAEVCRLRPGEPALLISWARPRWLTKEG